MDDSPCVHFVTYCSSTSNKALFDELSCDELLDFDQKGMCEVRSLFVTIKGVHVGSVSSVHLN